jgi:hypothetical protein
VPGRRRAAGLGPAANIDGRDGTNVEMVLFAGACDFVARVKRIGPR